MTMKRWRLAAALFAAAATLPAAARAGDFTDPGTETGFKYGFNVDLYESLNLNEPASSRNAFHMFDIKDRDADLGLAEFWSQYGRKPFGYRLDLDFGRTARLVNFNEGSRGDALEHLQQAYVSVNLTKSARTWLDFGKFVSPMGAEPIEATNNWLTSRGLLTTYATPYYLSGLRVTHQMKNGDWVMAHVNRGWNMVDDPNHDYGGGVTVRHACGPHWDFKGSMMSSEETDLTGGRSWMHVIDAVATWKGARLSSTLNADIGRQGGDNFYGVSGQVHWMMTGRQALIGRGEALRDEAGRLFGSRMTVYSASAGYSCAFNRHLEGRIEYRHDFANEQVFPGKSLSGMNGQQGVFTASCLMRF